MTAHLSNISFLLSAAITRSVSILSIDFFLGPNHVIRFISDWRNKSIAFDSVDDAQYAASKYRNVQFPESCARFLRLTPPRTVSQSTRSKSPTTPSTQQRVNPDHPQDKPVVPIPDLDLSNFKSPPIPQRPRGSRHAKAKVE